ncbi:MAG TPA: hypothetical protein VJT75_12530, partial [Thermoleophilaceae bacterium]|nr:hypothetical protein [Thermoleophilaceae bacterium]
MRRGTLALTTLGFALLTAGGAGAGGGPVTQSYDPGGAAVPGVPVRYLALRGKHETVVAKVRRDGGQVLRSRALRGDYAIPGVSVDGSGEGLSANGGTLVVVRTPDYSRRVTRTALAILDARPLRVRRTVTLRGDFGYDALSPDGRTLYLVQYLSGDQARYAVRAYDVRAGRLRPGAIVDRSEPDEEMRGYPVARLYGPGHRWAYTLYDGGGKQPFVHALDTVAGVAHCVDLPMVRAVDVFDASLATRSAGRRLAIVTGPRRHELATIDTATLTAAK